MEQKAVREVAHKITMAGHMGKTKTARRILQRFYWPTLYKDIADHWWYQKAWYVRNARERFFKLGDQVLILLPVPTNKLMVQWQGPYPMLRYVGSVTYEIDVVDRRKRKRILHVNMLRKWCVPAGDAYWAEKVADGVDNEIPTWDKGSVPKGGSVLGDQLNAR